jgi:hypothetical protein
MADMAKMEDWLGTIPSPQTRKNYRSIVLRKSYSRTTIENQSEVLSIADQNILVYEQIISQVSGKNAESNDL